MELKMDLYRYYGDKKMSFFRRVFKSPELKFLFMFRKYRKTSCKVLKKIRFFQLKRYSRKSHIHIDPNTQIAGGFYIGHYGRIIINGDTVIGKNVNIATGVTIGQESRGTRKGCPLISDNVWIGTNAVVVGNIKIGTNVLIAPLSFVNFDVPDNSIVIGNPAKIIHNVDATHGYVVRKVD